MDPIFVARERRGNILTIDRFEVGKKAKRKMVMARIFDPNGKLLSSIELNPRALLELYGTLNRRLPELLEED